MNKDVLEQLRIRLSQTGLIDMARLTDDVIAKAVSKHDENMEMDLLLSYVLSELNNMGYSQVRL